MKNIFFFPICFLLLAACGADMENKQQLSKPLVIQELPFPGADTCGEPYLFTDKQGNVRLSWLQKEKDRYFLKFSELSGDTWKTAITIDSGTNWFVNWADYPIISGDGKGVLMAYYMQKSDSGKFTYDVKYRVSADNGKSWSSPALLNTDGAKAEHGFVSAVPHEDGFVSVWLDGRNTVPPPAKPGTPQAHVHEGHHGQMTIRALTTDSKGIRKMESELDGRVCDCCQTSIAMTNRGPVVVYRDRSDLEVRDIGIVRMENGQWTKPSIVAADNWKIEGCPVNGPRVDARGSNVAVAWFTTRSDSGVAKIAFSADAGATFRSPVDVSDLTAIGRVDLVLVDDKVAIVSWLEGTSIKARKVYSDGKKGPAIVIAETSSSRSSGFPQMTASGDRVVFAWTDSERKSVRIAALPGSSLH